MMLLLITYVVGVVLFTMTTLVAILIRGRVTRKGFWRLFLISLLWPGFVLWAVVQEYEEEQNVRK